jgi:large subunit ribosomal protein L3
MTQRFDASGRVVPCTVLEAGPCTVTAVRSGARDGYEAVQLGFGRRRRLSKPVAGQLRGLVADGVAPSFRWLREVRLASPTSGQRGQVVEAASFAAGDVVAATATTKGRGFQGVVKRHGFHGSPKTHGHKDQLRMPGSIGSTGPQRVLKGVRMAGRMGDVQVTTKNLVVVDVDASANQITVRGAVPGPVNGLVILTGAGEVSFRDRAEAAPVASQAAAEPMAEAPAAEPAAAVEADS